MKLICCLLVAMTSLFPRARSAAQQTEPAVPSQSSKIVLRKGTEISLKLAQDINSRTAKEDELVEFLTAEPVKVGDVVVADSGSRAIGTVSHSVRPNFWGDPGELVVKLTFLKAGKTKVPIRGSKFETGNYRVLLRGSQALIKQGTTTKGYVESDTEIEISGPAPNTPTSERAEPEPSSGETAQPAGTIRLQNGTSVLLLLSAPISSKTAKVGDPVKLQVLEDVKVGDLIVIASRAPATGIIEEAKAAGMAWHRGKVGIRIQSVTLINNEQWPVEAATEVAGAPTNAMEGWGAAIYESQGLALFALPLAPLQHGNQATMRRAMELEAMTKGEIVLDRSVVEALQPKPEIAGSGPATVTFYYPQFEKARFHEIWSGPTKLGELKQGRKITLKFAPGSYSFHVRKQMPGTEVHLEAGMRYYARIGFLQALLATDGTATGITIVPFDIGELEAADARDMQFKAMPDTMSLTPAVPPGGLAAQK